MQGEWEANFTKLTREKIILGEEIFYLRVLSKEEGGKYSRLQKQRHELFDFLGDAKSVKTSPIRMAQAFPPAINSYPPCIQLVSAIQLLLAIRLLPPSS